MAHQDFSKICPIFKEGSEKEIYIANYKASTTISISIPIWKMPAGREIELVEAYAIVWTSESAYFDSASCTIGLFKVQGSTSSSLSNKIGSVGLGSADISTSGCAVAAFSMQSVGNASVQFTSTDLIALGNVSAAGSSERIDVVIRYRDK